MHKRKGITKLLKILKGFGRSLHLLIEVVLIVLIALLFALRTSTFQTWLAQKAAQYLEKKIGTEVAIDKVDINFFDEVYLKGIYLEDQKEDTLLYSNEIKVNLGIYDFSKNEFEIDLIELNEAYISLRKYKGDSTLNFQYIIDEFASDKPKDTSTTNFKLTLNKVALRNINFLFHDENSEPLGNGLDFSHINLQNLSVDFSEMEINGEVIKVNLEDLRFKERSGLILADFDAKILYSPELISLDNLQIVLNNSVLRAPYFKLNTPNRAEDFGDFVNKVKFESKIENSKISLKDVSYFVPQIWGMDDDINLLSVELTGPVYGMKLNNLHLTMLDTTELKGDFMIPNMADENANLNEEITLFRTSISDVQRINLSPFIAENGGHLKIAKNLARAKLIRLEDTRLNGSLNEFIVGTKLYSGLGNVIMNNDMQFSKDKAGIYSYYPIGKDPKHEQIVIQKLHVEALSGTDIIGLVDGHLSISGKGFDPKTMVFNFAGVFNDLEINGYDYNNIHIKNGQFHNNEVDCKLTVDDENLVLNYEGNIDLKGEMEFNVDLDLDTMNLTKLLDLDTVDLWLSGQMTSTLKGTDLNKMEGSVNLVNWHYNTPQHKIDLNALSINIERGELNDSITVASDFLDADIFGKIDVLHIYPIIETQLSYVLNNIFKPQDIPVTGNHHFVAEINLKNVNPILELIDSALYIEPESKIAASYKLTDKELYLSFDSERILYSGLEFLGIHVNNHFTEERANIIYSIDFAKPNDSLKLKDLYLDGLIKNNSILTDVGYFGAENIKPGLFAFTTNFNEDGSILLDFDPSFFHVRDDKWQVNSDSKILYSEKVLEITDFIVQNGDHYLKLNGKVSENPDDWLNFNVHDFDLENLNSLLGGDLVLGGKLNLKGGVSDVYNEIKLKSESDIQELYLNRNLVGDIGLSNGYDQSKNSVSFDGTLKREGIETFQFLGNYYVDKEFENIDANLIFNKTDIGFLSAFEDKELYTDISGFLNGKLDVSGELVNPIIKGKLDLMKTKVTVPMFGVFFTADGPINIENGLIYTDHLKLYDQENNVSEVIMSVQHTDWGMWNYDITLDMENPERSKRFLVMDTKYKEGDVYYGKAFITGFVNIFGYDDITEINVEATTQKGTAITIPLYGNEELSDESFIIFDTIVPRPENVKKGSIAQAQSTGLKLNMTFHVNKNANLKVVLDPVLEDQVEIADGAGDIKINLDEFGELTMFGKYVINEGTYAMNLNNLKKEVFWIKKESYIRWDSDPLDAKLDVTASFLRNVSLEPIMPLGAVDRTSRKDRVISSLVLKGNLSALGEPDFKLNAPEADESGRDALRSLAQSKDEERKQFFSLFVLERFVPIAGKTAGGGNELIAGAVSDGVNGLLGGITGSTSVTAELGAGSNSVGVSRQINERVTITSSLGVANSDGGEGAEESSTSEIVGDVKVEYRLNDEGTFTLNFFNETNQGTDAGAGHFTQGVSLHYEETFNTGKEFKLLQRFLNIFRGKENDVEVGKTITNRKVPIPSETD